MSFTAMMQYRRICFISTFVFVVLPELVTVVRFSLPDMS